MNSMYEVRDFHFLIICELKGVKSYGFRILPTYLFTPEAVPVRNFAHLMGLINDENESEKAGKKKNCTECFNE